MSLSSVGLPDGWEPPPGLLQDRVILITGACGGLGSAVVRAAAGAGATVVLCGRRQRPLERLHDALCAEHLPQPVIHPLDLESATPEDYAALAQALERDLGHLDGVVHAAASFSALTPLAMHRPDDWLRVLHVNVSAPFALMQACLPLLERAPDSAAVFLLDDPERLARAHWGGYGVSKAALERYVEILQQEHDGGSLRVHALLPGPMRTTLRRAAYFGEDSLQHPLPEVTAAAVLYLLAPAGAAARGRLLDLRSS